MTPVRGTQILLPLQFHIGDAVVFGRIVLELEGVASLKKPGDGKAKRIVKKLTRKAGRRKRPTKKPAPIKRKRKKRGRR
jgi:hypothetical protein